MPPASCGHPLLRTASATSSTTRPGYMGVTIMQPDRRPPAGDQQTPEEALASYSTYTSYFGTFTVNEAEGFLTHHLEGSLNTRGAGSAYKRFYTLSGNRLTLQPPAGENANTSQLTWEKLPDLSESELTETHKRLFGFYRIESVSRRIVDGESLPANQYDTAFLIYAPSGHMAVHLMRPGAASRTPAPGRRRRRRSRPSRRTAATSVRSRCMRTRAIWSIIGSATRARGGPGPMPSAPTS